MEYVKSFRDLEVYKLLRQLSGEIFELSKKFPKEEMYLLTDQIRRASRSVGGQIAEAWAKRNYEKHFIILIRNEFADFNEEGCWVRMQESLLHPKPKPKSFSLFRKSNFFEYKNVKKCEKKCKKQP